MQINKLTKKDLPYFCGRYVRSAKAERYEVGGFARSTSMGFRLYYVMSVEPLVIRRIGDTNFRQFSPTFRSAPFELNVEKNFYWYKPVNLYFANDDMLPHCSSWPNIWLTADPDDKDTIRRKK
jgi:hypothetical protein